MDTTAAPTYKDLEARVAQLEKHNEKLLAEKKSFGFLASYMFWALSLQRGSVQPEGFWIRAKHLPVLKSFFQFIGMPTSTKLPAEETWMWHKFPRSLQGLLPRFPTQNQRWTKQDLEAYVVKPFERPFPLELFQIIISFADSKAVSRTARASFACYELSMPVLLQWVYALNSQTIRDVFARTVEGPARSARLILAGGFQYVKRLCICPSALEAAIAPLPVSFNLARLPPTSAMDLDVLKIAIDIQSNFPELPLPEIFPAHSQRFLCLLNPAELVIEIDLDEVEGSETTYVISKEAAFAISQWTRLRTVILDDVNLIASLDEDEDEDGIEDESDGVWFLSERSGQLNGLGELDVVWDLSAYEEDLPSFGYDNLLDLLLHRDETLRQPWVKSFTIVVRTQEIGKKFQSLIDQSEAQVPSCLKWEVTKVKEEEDSA